MPTRPRSSKPSAPQKAPLPPNAVEVTSRIQWRAWLAANHRQLDGIWLVTYKKATGRKHLPNADVVEEALCFGWIDSKPRALDDERSMLWLAPRKAGTNWSGINRERVARMIAEGRMTAAGQAKVDVAKADGSFSALEAVDALTIPDDLATAFRRQKGAAANFDAFPKSTKKGILEWIQIAKRPETRAARILETATLAARNERANQWKPK
jgi:uncharacterized protein YdeI (YjbR/CyaY-like superfamily)